MASVADQLVDIAVGPESMPAHLWVPDSGHGPGLVLLQEIFGVSAYIKQRAADLCELGYVVLAPEIYWRLSDAEIDESTPDFLAQAMGVVSRLDWPTAVTDAQAALQSLRTRPDVRGVGVIGFCFGGGLGFNVAAVDRPDVLVSYYGSALPGLLDLAEQVTAPSLHHFGLADTFIDNPTIAKIEVAVASPTTIFEKYEGAGHAFDNPMPAFHHAAASAQAWASTTAFLGRHLPV